ncbi:MAG: hypothetical protein H0U49_02410 [Parachlamydiaceae bacterium]|nr:hypothetical protein [Parachlamydiaceae bacterium]
MSLPNIYTSSPQNEYTNYSLFNDRISGFLTETQNIAANIVNPMTNAAAIRALNVPRVAVGYYVAGSSAYSFGNSFSSVKALEDRRTDADAPMRMLFDTITAIAGSVSRYFIDQVVNAKMCIESTLKYLARFRKIIESESKNHPHHPHLKAIKKIVDCEYIIFKKMEEKIQIKLASRVSAAVAGIFTLIGALVLSQTIVALGIILCFGTVLGSIFNVSYKYGEKEMAVNAKTMLAVLETLKNEKNMISSCKPVRTSEQKRRATDNVLNTNSTKCCATGQAHESTATDNANSPLATSTVHLPVPENSTQSKSLVHFEARNINSLATNEFSTMSGNYPSPTSAGTANYAIPGYATFGKGL